jgi:hypothetical protein
MRITDATSFLSLSAVVLAAVAGGCSPAPVVVAEPAGTVMTSISQPDESVPVPTEDIVQDAIAPTEPVDPMVAPTMDAGSSEPVAEGQADAIADWPVFRDDEYGFQVAYPPEWGFMDLPVYDSGVGGPPTVIRRFVILYRQEWEEWLKPGGDLDPNVSSYPALSIEISVGAMKAFRREFMELGGSETIEINGLTVLREWDTYEDYNLIRYVFQHPANDELRITLTDPVSGFSVRAEENEEIVSLIPAVVSTFKFTE